jgi:hypothetical protein
MKYPEPAIEAVVIKVVLNADASVDPIGQAAATSTDRVTSSVWNTPHEGESPTPKMPTT